jgi:putative nucleotidyltransferase with HDIG domain
MSAERFARLSRLASSALPIAVLILVLFIIATTALLGIDTSDGLFGKIWKPLPDIFALAAVVIMVSCGTALYVYHYQDRIIRRPPRAIALAGLFVVLLTLTKVGLLLPEEWIYLATGSAVTSAIVLTIAYNQRFAIGMSLFYSILACFAVGSVATVELFMTMMAGVITCCFSLREIRTRMKLIEVTTLAAVAVFITAASLNVIQKRPIGVVLGAAGAAAAITIAVGVVIQGFLPIIEKVFGIATSMTLMDYSDANQPLLKKLAMDAPGTFSHSLLIGSIAESAAEAIGANGLLCRVGAYYHDVGKINKPSYFVENQMGSASRHEQLSPAMSQLVIVGHVKDGIEIAREFGLPTVLRQFIETHHGTTLIEYFYNEAKRQQDDKQTAVSESEFRYPGPKPRIKEAAIVMLADTVESATRSLTELTPTRIESVVHNMAMKRLQDGQFDECDLTLRELSQIEVSISKSLTAHHHGRIAYPNSPDKPVETTQPQPQQAGKG